MDDESPHVGVRSGVPASGSAVVEVDRPDVRTLNAPELSERASHEYRAARKCQRIDRSIRVRRPRIHMAITEYVCKVTARLAANSAELSAHIPSAATVRERDQDDPCYSGRAIQKRSIDRVDNRPAADDRGHAVERPADVERLSGYGDRSHIAARVDALQGSLDGLGAQGVRARAHSDESSKQPNEPPTMDEGGLRQHETRPHLEVPRTGSAPSNISSKVLHSAALPA